MYTFDVVVGEPRHGGCLVSHSWRTFKTTVLVFDVVHSTQAPVANDGDGDDGRRG